MEPFALPERDLVVGESLAQASYCGAPPLPAEIWLRWNLDIALIVALAALMIAHGVQLGVLSMAKRRTPQPRRLFFYTGWIALTFAVISPLCALGVALFSARVAQHAWLTMLAAPLLVLASVRPQINPMARPMTGAAIFAAALWSWHLPPLYELTFRSDLAYWLMHVSLFGAATLLWRGLIHGGERAWLARVGAGFLTVAQMGLLGALITLAPRPLYEVHLLTTEGWRLTPLEDQQLGGLIMWAPTAFVLLAAALSVVYEMLDKRAGRIPARAAER
jgi:putative membrane protein